MKKLYTLIIACLTLCSCDDGMDIGLPIKKTDCETYGFTTFSTAICIEDNSNKNLLAGLLDEQTIEVECIRQSDSARMTLSDYQLYSIPVADNLLNLPSPVIYLSWMDMDALTSRKSYDVNYILRIHCASLWGQKTHEVVWHMYTENKKVYPYYCSYNNHELEVEYISLLSDWTAFVRVTLQ